MPETPCLEKARLIMTTIVQINGNKDVMVPFERWPETEEDFGNPYEDPPRNIFRQFEPVRLLNVNLHIFFYLTFASPSISTQLG